MLLCGYACVLFEEGKGGWREELRKGKRTRKEGGEWGNEGRLGRDRDRYITAQLCVGRGVKGGINKHTHITDTRLPVPPSPPPTRPIL